MSFVASRYGLFLACLVSLGLSSLYPGDADSYGQMINRTYAFTNFDGAAAELTLHIPQAYYDTTLVDWTAYVSQPGTPDQNYKALVRGLFQIHKDGLRFAFDVFDQELKGVSDEYLLQTLIRFVQSLPYRLPPLEYQGRETFGLLSPVAALVEGYGDCDTKSLLLAALAAHRFNIVFLVGARHAFIGIEGEPGLRQNYVVIDGKNYILCEMTSSWPLGILPESSKEEINNGLFTYFTLP